MDRSFLSFSNTDTIIENIRAMDDTNVLQLPEVWGGLECTINRVGNQFKDQLAYSGHYERSGDIEKIAGLGIKSIRYPVLWEKHQPIKNQNIDWTWTDRQLESIRLSGMRPIVGLVHHGSGPVFTNLLDPEFPYLLAAYAYEVASRYPWIEFYTPVNEPLTTARFSGLYGLWYPHHKNEGSFYKMLLNQLKGSVLAMEAIRSVNPLAKLVQTEDLGKTHSTSLLAYQAEFENDRRLLTFDILTGKVKEGHPNFEYMLGCGIQRDELYFFEEQPMEPDVLGLNYYVTSERWLDESVEKYHPSTYGGNGRHRYADTEMVRANEHERAGLKKLASEIWDRYHLPLAITEAHLHCTREEQLRWFKEIWDAAVSLTQRGVDMRGVTAWALLGSFDWDTILTKTGTQYESGVFDIKTFPGTLRPTALASLIWQLAGDRNNFHPVMSAPGWWTPPSLDDFKDQSRVVIVQNQADQECSLQTKKLVHELLSACEHRRINSVLTHHLNEDDLKYTSIWAVINISGSQPKTVAYCAENNIQYVTFCPEEELSYGLRIITDLEFLTVHQINKVLDLMIDGDEGCWVFDKGEITFRTNTLVPSR